MDSYRRALSAYLEPKERTQEWLAGKINRSQAAVNRYVNGERFPDAATAKAIEEATEGSVPFSAWQTVAMEKFGIGEAA